MTMISFDLFWRIEFRMTARYRLISFWTEFSASPTFILLAISSNYDRQCNSNRQLIKHYSVVTQHLPSMRGIRKIARNAFTMLFLWSSWNPAWVVHRRSFFPFSERGFCYRHPLKCSCKFINFMFVVTIFSLMNYWHLWFEDSRSPPPSPWKQFLLFFIWYRK